MPNNIPLTKGWRLISDARNWIIAKEDGDRITNQSFHETPEGAIQSFIARKVKGFNAKSIEGLLQSIKALETRLHKALRPLNLEVRGVKE